MDLNNLPPLIWFLIGLLCIISEFYIPGLIIIFFGIGAWVVAGVLAIGKISLLSQIIIFIFTSVASLFLLRKKIMEKSTSDKNELDDFIGKTACVHEPVSKRKFGKVFFKGTYWKAETNSDETMEQGEYVRIVGRESILLIVEPIKEDSEEKKR